MQLRRIISSTIAVAVLGLVSGLATADHDIDFDAIGGPFQLALEDYRGQSTNGDKSIDKAIATFETDYNKSSKAMNKIANAVGKLDKSFKDDAAYQDDADAFMNLMAVVHIGDTSAAGAAIGQAVARNPRGPAARAAQSLVRKLTKLNTFWANESKPRKTKLKKQAGVQRLAEKLIRRFG